MLRPRPAGDHRRAGRTDHWLTPRPSPANSSVRGPGRPGSHQAHASARSRRDVRLRTHGDRESSDAVVRLHQWRHARVIALARCRRMNACEAAPELWYRGPGDKRRQDARVQLHPRRPYLVDCIVQAAVTTADDRDHPDRGGQSSRSPCVVETFHGFCTPAWAPCSRRPEGFRRRDGRQAVRSVFAPMRVEPRGKFGARRPRRGPGGGSCARAGILGRSCRAFITCPVRGRAGCCGCWRRSVRLPSW